ncbi:MAG: hypothetical protein Q9187_008262 [Circinaria calcarea]
MSKNQAKPNDRIKEIQMAPKCEQLTTEQWRECCRFFAINDTEHVNPQSNLNSVAGPTLLICPATLIGNWIKEFNRHFDSASGMKLLVAHNKRFKNGEQLNVTKHGHLLLAASTRRAKEDQTRLVIITSQESYESAVAGKFFRSSRSPRQLAEDAIKEERLRESSIEIRWGLVMRDEFHLRVNAGAGTVKILKNFFRSPRLILASGTPVNGGSSRLIGYIGIMPYQIWGGTPFDIANPANLEALAIQIRRAIKFKDQDDLRQAGMNSNKFLKRILLARTESCWWFGKPCKIDTLVTTSEHALTLKPKSLASINSFFRRCEINEQSPAEKKSGLAEIKAIEAKKRRGVIAKQVSHHREIPFDEKVLNFSGSDVYES